MEEKQRNKIATEIQKQQEKDNVMPSIIVDNVNKGRAFVQFKKYDTDETNITVLLQCE